MWFRKKKKTTMDETEARIKAIQSETFQAVDKANQKTKQLNEVLEKGGTTYLIFLATGGDRRNEK